MNRPNSGRKPWRWIYAKKKNGKASDTRGNNATTKNNTDTSRAGVSDGESSENQNQTTATARAGIPTHALAEDNDDLPLPPPKRRRRAAPKIYSAIVSQWIKKFPGYLLYYHASQPKLDGAEGKIHLVIDFLKRIGYTSRSKILGVEEAEYYSVPYDNVIKDAVLMEGWPSFAEDLVEDPQEVLNVWGLAMHKVVHDFIESDDELQIGESQENVDPNETHTAGPHQVNCIRAGIMKLEPVVSLMSIKSSMLSRLVTIRGAVVRTGNIKPLCVRMTFECKICNGRFTLNFPDGHFRMPKRCGADIDCENKSNFEILESAKTTKLIDCRRMRLQDIQHNDNDRGSVPRTIDCEFFNGLVNLCNAGDAVSVTGIVKMSKEISYGKEQSLHNIYLEAVAVRNHKDSERTMGGNWFSFSNLDFYAIKEIYDTKHLFRLLIASLCPSIYGHELVKAGLLLSLFGGSVQSDEIVSRRSNINLLMVGDPGIGKSQMLKMVNEVAPRGVYVCGTGSTVAGLTVTLTKDGDEYSLEAGALVMADRGVCCIDEFDKMQAQHHALLEAMEQMSISVAKSGVYRTLPARTTVVGAANPVGGHYDEKKTVSENIKMSPALMSRFDLIFIMLDKPNQEFDRKMAEHLMGMKVNAPRSSQISPQVRDHIDLESSSQQPNLRLPLAEKVKFGKDEEVDLIPRRLLRKYISYARQYVKPKISPEAAAVLKEYYLRLRVKHRMINSTPVTTRQLESLVRLTEARAKLELREIATEEDAKDVLEIFEFSLSSAFDNEVIAMSAMSQPVIISSSMSQSQSRGNAKRLVLALQTYAEKQSKNLFTEEEIRNVGSALGLKSVVGSLICALNNEGFLLKKAGNTYQLQIVDC